MLYSLTAGVRELLHLRTPALADLHMACATASLACAKPAAPAAQGPAASVSVQAPLLWYKSSGSNLKFKDVVSSSTVSPRPK